MKTRNQQPSLKVALASALKTLKQGNMHTKPDGKHMADCPHNAGLIFGCLQSMVLDSGYIALGIMLGSIVRPCIDSAPTDCTACGKEPRLPVIIETYHPGTPREDGCGIDAPPNTTVPGVLKGVRARIRLYNDGGASVELVTAEHPYGIQRYALSDAVKAALEADSN